MKNKKIYATKSFILKMTNASLAREAGKLLKKNIRSRGFHKVTMAEMTLMLAMHRAGLTYRSLESVFHLEFANGMNAYRCVRQALKVLRGKENQLTR